MKAVPVEIDGANRKVLLIAGNVPAPAGFQDFWIRGFAPTGANALIIGEDALIVRVLDTLWPTLRKPVVHCEGRRLILPVSDGGTLVIRDAHRLVVRDQQRLLEWWDPCATHTRIIACASPQLFTFVEDGAFSRCLFDRFTDVKLAKAAPNARWPAATRAS